MKIALTTALLIAAIAPTLASNAAADRRMANARERDARTRVFNYQFAARSRALWQEQQQARQDPSTAMLQRTPSGRILIYQQQRQRQLNAFWGR